MVHQHGEDGHQLQEVGVQVGLEPGDVGGEGGGRGQSGADALAHRGLVGVVCGHEIPLLFELLLVFLLWPYTTTER